MALVLTEPMPWFREQDVALVEVQVRVEEFPATIEVGAADNETAGAAGADVTVTVAVPVAVPPAPVHVRTYEVDTVGETEREPLVATAPTA